MRPPKPNYNGILIEEDLFGLPERPQIQATAQRRGNHARSFSLAPSLACLHVVRMRVKKRPRKPAAFEPLWRVAHLAASPDTPECLRMLGDLVRLAHSQNASAALIGCPLRSIAAWISGERKPAAAATRGIWATWARFLHPELLELHDCCNNRLKYRKCL